MTTKYNALYRKVLLCLCVSPSILASEPVQQPFNQRVGTFVEVNIGTFTSVARIYVEGEDFVIDESYKIHGVNLSAAIGHMFLPFFGAEIGVNQSQSTYIDNKNTNVFGAVRFHLPFGERFKMVTKLGMSANTTHDNDIHAKPFFSFGGSYAIGTKVDCNLNFKNIFDTRSSGVISLGLTYHF